MERLNDYLTTDGWKADYKQTKTDMCILGKGAKEGLSGILTDESGEGEIGCLLAIALMPVGAYLGSYLGQGCGWLWGSIVDVIPGVNEVAPWLAERCGDLAHGLSRHETNVEFYQVSGAISGFWAGLSFPLNMWRTTK